MPDPWFFEVGWIGEVADLDPFAEFLAGLPGRTFVYGAGYLDDGTPEGAPARAERYRVERDEARAEVERLREEVARLQAKVAYEMEMAEALASERSPASTAPENGGAS